MKKFYNVTGNILLHSFKTQVIIETIELTAS